MATIIQQSQSQERRGFWRQLQELDFLSAFFSWFFMLLTRLSEPLMLLATLYVVAEAGVPAIAVAALHNLAIGVMITAPEVILPGAFVVASRSQEYARMLFAMCWLFVVLTLVTLVSLFVWHLEGASLQWLMCARCAAAVGYSILMRVMSHGQVVEPVVHQQEREQRIEQAMNQFNIRLQEVQTELRQQVQQVVQSHVAEQVQGVQSTLLEQVTTQITSTMQEFKRDMRSAIAEATVSSSPARSPKGARQLQSVPTLVQHEPASEPANVRVPRFIQEQVNQGHKPTLSEIVDACQCSRNTAIRYRRDLLGDEEGVA